MGVEQLILQRSTTIGNRIYVRQVRTWSDFVVESGRAERKSVVVTGQLSGRAAVVGVIAREIVTSTVLCIDGQVSSLLSGMLTVSASDLRVVESEAQS